MNKEIISALLPAAMLGEAKGVEESFRKMSVNIDRVLRSDFARGTSQETGEMSLDKPYIITANDGILREDDVTKESTADGLLDSSARYDKPYVAVPRVVGNE